MSLQVREPEDAAFAEDQLRPNTYRQRVVARDLIFAGTVSCYQDASVRRNHWEHSARLLHAGTQLLVPLQTGLVAIAAFVFFAAG